MSIVKHIKEHAKLGIYGSGTKFLTVGDNGQFTTIDAALAYIAGQTGATQVSHAATTGDVTQYSDSVTNLSVNLTSVARAGDLLNFTDNESGAPTVIGQSYAVATYYPIYDLRSTTAVLMTGRVGATGSGVGIQLWRPNTYILALAPGHHVISASVTLPNLSNVAIVGTSKTNTFLSKSGSAVVTYPRHGYLSVSNVCLYGQDSTVNGAHTIFTYDSSKPFDAGFCVFNIHDIMTDVVRPNSGGTNDLFLLRGSAAWLSNIQAQERFVTIGTVEVDFLTVDNIHLTSSANHHCLILQNTHTYQFTKPWFLSNLDLVRQDNAAGQSDRVLAVGGQLYSTAGGSREYYLRGLKILDLNSANVDQEAFAVTPSLGDTFYLHDCVIETSGSGGVADMQFASALGAATVVMDNVRNLSGATPTYTDSSGNITLTNYTPMGSQSLAYGVTLSPNANKGSTIVVGTLTGNVTAINAPTNPLSGQKIRFMFTQDATAGHTVAGWDAAFIVTTAVPGGGTNGQKCMIGFEYDGSKWIQDIAPIWG